MSQSEMADLVQEEILRRLSDEDIELLARLSEDEDDHEEEIKAILERNNLDPHTIAKELSRGEKQ